MPKGFAVKPEWLDGILDYEIIPSQAGEKSLGVCREHEPTAKAKMCSDLHGDMQRSAEMTDPTQL